MANAPGTGLLARLALRQDLALVGFLIATLAMMVLPMPAALADVLIAVSICIALMLMLVAIYIRSPVEFSTLPTVILMTTAFRLSLSITTSRLVLLKGDAGEIIRTFGDFVIAGNVVVGLVVYLIITIVQFVVITKGSERVAEVAARFTLDALPGKQISIDTDLRNGDIDQQEARRRRQTLEKQSQLYGAMDGAMKFVKGDAIASLVIIAVNLIGGMAIGCVQRGLSFSQAVQTYSLLAVGDGLIAQIPALLVSLTAGVIVTRVTSEGEDGNLGRDVLGQLMGEPRSLQVAAAVMVALGCIPGFPMAVFLVLGALLGGGGWWLARYRRQQAALFAAQTVLDEGAEPALIEIRIGDELLPLFTKIDTALGEIRTELMSELGITVPRLRLKGDGRMPPDGFRIEIDGMPTAEGIANPSWAYLAQRLPADLSAEFGIEARLGPWSADCAALPLAELDALRVRGVEAFEAPAAVALVVRRILLGTAGQFVGIQETQALLHGMEANYGDLVREALKAVPLPRLAELLRRLIEEQVPVTGLRQILEAAAEWGTREPSLSALTDHVRVAVRRQICHRWASGDRILPVIATEGALEEALRPQLRTSPAGMTSLILDAARATGIANAVRDCLAHGEGARRPVVLTAFDLRRHLRLILHKAGIDVIVLSHQEIAPDFSMRVIGTLRSPLLTGGVERVARDAPAILSRVKGVAA
jgi:type III secretion protein V